MNIGDVGQFLVGVAALGATLITLLRVNAVKREVTPNNGLTAGETDDRIYSLLINMIEPKDRTEGQEEHMNHMDEQEAEGGPARE